MRVLLEDTCEPSLIDISSFEALILFAMGALELPDHAEVSVSFVDVDEMTTLNGEYRGKEGPTDVLSFECDNLDDGFPSMTDGGDPFVLGDIIISPEVAIKQAKEYGTTSREEIELLLVHGLLHLMGYDHIDDAEARVMESEQRDILRAWHELVQDGRHE